MGPPEDSRAQGAPGVRTTPRSTSCCHSARSSCHSGARSSLRKSSQRNIAAAAGWYASPAASAAAVSPAYVAAKRLRFSPMKDCTNAPSLRSAVTDACKQGGAGLRAWRNSSHDAGAGVGACSQACLRGRADTGKVAEVVEHTQQGGIARMQAADAQPICTPATSTGALTRQAGCMGALLAGVPCHMGTACAHPEHISPHCAVVRTSPCSSQRRHGRGLPRQPEVPETAPQRAARRSESRPSRRPSLRISHHCETPAPESGLMSGPDLMLCRDARRAQSASCFKGSHASSCGPASMLRVSCRPHLT